MPFRYKMKTYTKLIGETVYVLPSDNEEMLKLWIYKGSPHLKSAEMQAKIKQMHKEASEEPPVDWDMWDEAKAKANVNFDGEHITVKTCGHMENTK